MSDETTTTETVELDEALALFISSGLSSFDSATAIVEQAIAHGLVAAEPITVGDHGLIFRQPDGALSPVDVRTYEDEARLPSFISATPKFVSVESLARYVERYAVEESTVAYISDTYGKGIRLLTADNDVAWITIDEHPRLAEGEPDDEHPRLAEGEPDDVQRVGRRAHTASLVLRPTEAGKRWGQALNAPQLSQEQFLDLIVDGIAEIAEPDGAVLRDLVSDLHAIRTTEVQSVVRTGGEGSIQLADNVKLHAGQGNEVTFPETLKATFVPFVGVAEPVVLTVRIKPAVGSNKVVFSLSCAQLEDQLARTMGTIAATIAEHTSLNPLWKP